MPNAFGYSSYPQRPAVKPSDVGAALMRRAQPQPMAGLPPAAMGAYGAPAPQPMGAYGAPAPQSPFGVR